MNEYKSSPGRGIRIVILNIRNELTPCYYSITRSSHPWRRELNALICNYDLQLLLLRVAVHQMISFAVIEDVAMGIYK